jgi:aminoglycoside phosphotransferase (APT) family kinase protein
VSATPSGRGIADLGATERRTAAALAAIWPGCGVRELRPLPGGASSLTFVTEVTGAPAGRVAVKMAPPGLPPVRNRDVLRQARVLRALARVPEVAVPVIYAEDAGDPPDVPPFFVMEYVEGESYEPLLTVLGPGAARPADADVECRARTAARMLAALHRQDATALGFAGEPLMSLADECAKWARALATCGLQGEDARLEAECRRRLERGQPAPAAPVVLHGDWRLGNMQCAGPEVRAVIDWEIWSLGDPRVDLAWTMMWASRDNPGTAIRGVFMPAPEQLLAWYEAAAGRAVPELDWVQGLIRYKSAAVSALLVKNALKRGDPGAQLERRQRSIAATLEWALESLAAPS